MKSTTTSNYADVNTQSFLQDRYNTIRQWDRDAKKFFRSIDPLYPPGLDENGTVENLYVASWICSDNVLMYGRKITTAGYKFCTLHLTHWLECTVVNISRVQKFWGDSHLIPNIPRLGAWYGILKYLIKFHEGGDCWGGTVSACHTAQYNIKVSKHYCTTPSWLDNFVRCIVLLYFRGTRQLTNNQIYNPIAFRTMNCSSATLYLKEIGNKWAYIMHKTFVIQSFSYVNKRIYLPDRTSWNTRWFRINCESYKKSQ